MAKKERIPIKFFVSYAHKDDEYSDAFIDEFKEMTAPAEKYKYVIWQDSEILPGEKWKNEIQQALEKCSLGLLFVGRHMDTGQFNRRAPSLRSAVNSLHTPNTRTDLSRLLFDYLPHPDHPRLNAYFSGFEKGWNAVVLACIEGIERTGDPEVRRGPPADDLPEAVRDAIRTLQHVFRQVKGFRVGDPVANLIEPQLGYLLRDLEQAIQPGWGAAHGLFAIYEFERIPAR